MILLDFFFTIYIKASRNLKLKQHEFHSNEVNRNGRTALLIDHHQSINNNNHNNTTTPTSEMFLRIFS